ncbi:MAG: GNAT family N-acetyltransferase [Acidimicrobiales bacterium]
MELRPVRPSEYQTVGDLTVAAFAGLEGSGDLGDYADTLRQVEERASAALVLVAVEGGDVLGSVTYVSSPDNPYAEDLGTGDVGIRMLAVAPVAQGRGVGRVLTEACLATGRDAGAARVVLHSTPWMVVAHGLYASLGFVRRPERDVTIRPDLTLMAFALELG